MFICFFALWVVLNGRWTTEIGVFGLVFAALAYAFTWKYMGYSPKVDFALLMRAPSALRYGVNLIVELSKKAAAVLGDDFDIEIIEQHHNQKNHILMPNNLLCILRRYWYKIRYILLNILLYSLNNRNNLYRIRLGNNQNMYYHSRLRIP